MTRNEWNGEKQQSHDGHEKLKEKCVSNLGPIDE